MASADQEARRILAQAPLEGVAAARRERAGLRVRHQDGRLPLDRAKAPRPRHPGRATALTTGRDMR